MQSNTTTEPLLIVIVCWNWISSTLLALRVNCTAQITIRSSSLNGKKSSLHLSLNEWKKKKKQKKYISINRFCEFSVITLVLKVVDRKSVCAVGTPAQPFLLIHIRHTPLSFDETIPLLLILTVIDCGFA